MASLDVIALDPTVPQLRAPAVGDTYHFCRVVEFQDGTDAAPSITNVGDTNTGIYWPNADELAVSTNGVQRLSLGATTVFNETGADVDFRIEGDTDANLVFVDASTDRVGLGLNNPDRLLDVDGSSKFRGQILITSGEALTLGLQALQLPTGVESTISAGLSTRTGVAGESIIQFGNNMNTYYTGSVNAAKAGAMIRIDTRGVEPTPGASAYSVFQIQTRAAGVADPNYTVPVQIGAAPHGTFCIQTNGLATFNNGLTVNSNFTLGSGTANGVLYLNGSKVATSGSALTFSGTVFGVNGSAADGIARITGGASNFGGSLQFYADIGGGGNYYRAFINGINESGSGSALTFSTTTSGNADPGEKMRLDRSGNLGIGTSSPTFKLDVSGTSNVLQTTSSTTTNNFYQVTSSGTTVLQNDQGAYAFYTGGSERMRLTSSGNVGIGTSSPYAALQSAKVTASTPTGGSAAGIGLIVSNSNNAYGMQFGSASAGYGWIQQQRNDGTNTQYDLSLQPLGGNVGIGTSSPATKLDVAGAFGTSTTAFTITNSSAASNSNIARIDFRLANSFSGNGPCAAVWGINPNATSNNGGALVFGVAANGTNTTPSEVARFDQAGNLGIGTSSPTGILNIKTSNGQLLVQNGTSANQMRISAFNNAGNANAALIFEGYSSEYGRFDSSGNLGLGVTPSAWSGIGKTLQINTGGSFSADAANAYFAANCYYNGTNWIYQTTNNATRYTMASNSHQWYTAASGTAGNTITFTQAMTLDASGNLGVGTTSPAARLHVSGNGEVMRINPSTNGYLSWYRGSTWAGYIDAESSGDMAFANAVSTGAIKFITNSTERARITSGGDLLVGTTTLDVITANTSGFSVDGSNIGLIRNTVSGQPCYVANRKTDDGDLVRFCQDGTQEGSISVSGNTVSYNAFAGSHWSQLQDGSKPDILRGTVMESINELCVWPGEQNERLPKAKISDTAGSKKVYGVFMAWDNDWTETNDMYVTAVGAFICRVNGSVTVEEGDLLESNGDGTARVQTDDIIRSSTIGKVTSTVKTHEYDDGSYCVPTVLYCG